MHIIFLALGTNEGDRKKQIADAIRLLQEKITDMLQAPIYETKPVGYTQQENFYNTVIQGKTDLSPENLLYYTQSIEKKIGRKERFRNGPREIDIDILLYDDIVLHSENLIIPHPRMHERDFVLQPLSDTTSEMIHPVYKKTARILLKKLSKEKRSIIEKIP